MKKKFMTIYLREDEWNLIKKVMEEKEKEYERIITNYSILKLSVSSFMKKEYQLVYHFNHIAIDNIEELARKEERRRKRDKSKQKKD